MRALLVSVLFSIAACSGTTDLYAGGDFPLATAPVTSDAGAPAPIAPEPSAGAAAPALDAAMPDAAIAPEPDATPPAAPTCPPQTADCDGDTQNGCEADLTRDRDHCGSCRRACAAADCACEDGAFVAVCESGRADCDDDAQNGCEVDTASDLQNCGACARVCHTDGHDAITAECRAGRCELTCQFQQFEIDCDGDPDNGCETYIWTDAQNCGACGMQCSGGTCRDGRCF